VASLAPREPLKPFVSSGVVLRHVVVLAFACSCGSLQGATPAKAVDCSAYTPPPLAVSAEVQHLKTLATVIEVTSPCTVRVRIAGGMNALAPFNDKVIVLRAMERTTFKTAGQGDLDAIGRFGLKAGDVFTLSFDSRAFPDGSYPINYMNW
jgi:hypothetical protein